MPRTKTSTAIAITAGVLTLGAGVGAASWAAADPTPSPSSPTSSPSTATPTSGAGAAIPKAFGGHWGGPRGQHQQELAKDLAAKLGLPQSEVATALQEFRAQHRPPAPPAPGSTPSDPAHREAGLAKFLAGKLGLDQAKVKTALQEIRATHRAERAAALKTRLDTAVKAGTLTQAEADAVLKAFDEGVINVGPR